MINKNKTNVIDQPRKHGEDDLFEIKKYQDALVEFINDAQTPLTIALQGEWGSGKTSLMNTLRYELCDKDNKDAEFYDIWINTWQYSLLRQPGEAIIKILEGIIQQISEYQKEEDVWKDRKDRFKKILINLGKQGGKFVAKQVVDKVGGNTDYLDDLFEGGNSTGADISELKKEISETIKWILDKTKEKKLSKKGFVFFIDDLDRIDPPVAVQILELLKNIFDLQDCIFILAIDYDVVIKGLKPKFGELTEKNEREFRSFFDKIIQLPFSMPVASYPIDTFLIKALADINYLTEGEKNDTELSLNLTELTNQSVGTNPRSLKRLINTLSLIQIIYRKQENSEKQQQYEKVINFGLVCMQIAYPYIYNILAREPNFKEWDDQMAQKLKLRVLTEEEKNSLNSTKEFDEEWEKVLFRICQKETYSSNRVFQISQLLNKIKELVPEGMDLGEAIESILEVSAVTNLQAFDKPKVIDGKTSNYLKELRNKLFPVLQKHLIPPFDRVEQQAKRMISNMLIKFTATDWEYYFEIQARNKDNKYFVYAGADYPLMKNISNNLEEDLKSIGKSEHKKNIIDKLQELDKKHKKNNAGIGWLINPTAPNLFFIHKNNHHYYRAYFKISLNDFNEMLTDNFINNLAEIILDWQELMLKTQNIDTK